MGVDRKFQFLEQADKIYAKHHGDSEVAMSMFHIEQGMMNALLVGWSTYQGFIRPNSWFSQALLVVGRCVGGVG